MAHTDKDLPYWVKVQNSFDPVVTHFIGCPNHPLHRSTVTYYEYHEDGTSSPVTHSIARPCDLTQRGGRCRLTLRDPEPHRCEVSAAMRRGYYKRERASVRDILIKARADYNGNSDTEIEPEPRQHRRSTWGGGYWD